MKPVIIIEDYYQDIFITLGEAIKALDNCGRKIQVSTLLYYFRRCESHAQCMDVLQRYVDILIQEEK